MPFEPFKTDRPAVSRNGVNLAAARVLEQALRREMPPRWTWDFEIYRRPHPCGLAGCAIGLARHLKMIPHGQTLMSFLNLSRKDWYETFTSRAHTYGVPLADISATMVADRIAGIIAREEAA